jgi:hypothetical protein
MLVYTTLLLKNKKATNSQKQRLDLKLRNSRWKAPDFNGYKCIITSFGGHRVFL